jgi:integrase
MHPSRYAGREELVKARSDNYDYIICLLDTGARCSEISKLKWSQINLKEETINLHRTKAARGGYKNVSTI